MLRAGLPTAAAARRPPQRALPARAARATRGPPPTLVGTRRSRPLARVQALQDGNGKPPSIDDCAAAAAAAAHQQQQREGPSVDLRVIASRAWKVRRAKERRAKGADQ